MKVSDFEIWWDDPDGNLFNCCLEHVLEYGDEDAKENTVIECSYCGKSMILFRCPDNILRWREHNA